MRPVARRRSAKRAAAKPKGVKVRYLTRHITILTGHVDALYEASDGRRVAIRVRHGWRGAWELTAQQAKEAAVWRLTAKEGSIRLVSSEHGWHIYERTDGAQHAVRATEHRGAALTQAQTKQQAEKALEAR
jgi:hypothetical protein